MTKGEARAVRTVLRALAVVNTAARDLPEVVVPAVDLDRRSTAALDLEHYALPPSWRVKAQGLLR